MFVFEGKCFIFVLILLSLNSAGKNRESVAVKDNFELEVLQAQYKELKEKVRDLTCSFCS